MFWPAELVFTRGTAVFEVMKAIPARRQGLPNLHEGKRITRNCGCYLLLGVLRHYFRAATTAFVNSSVPALPPTSLVVCLPSR